jgi:tetratricopeptide (TPR) repeat protein
MNEPDKQIALVPFQPTELTKVGASSLIVRGLADLTVRVEAEEWLKKGLDFHSKLQWKEAYACFERGIRLNPNHPELQIWLGNMLTNGEGVRQDYTQAALWWRKAAEQGYAKAQWNLGVAYDSGQGVTQDYAQSALWWFKAAEQGLSDAQCWLGTAYQSGQGVTQDYTQAVFWWRKAAEQGQGRAQRDLGTAYWNGEGVTEDDTQAAFWWRKAAEQGYEEALAALRNM